jgi:actin-related protein
MFWLLKLIDDDRIPLPGKPDDYEQHPEKYILKISRQGNHFFKKIFTPDSQGNPLVKEIAPKVTISLPEPAKEHLVIEEKFNEKAESIETKPKEQKSEEKLDPNEIKVMFHSLKADMQKQIDKTVSEINERFEKIENKIKPESSKKLPRLVLSLIALVSFLTPFKSLHDPKLEPTKIKTSKPAAKPKVYYYQAPPKEVFTPIYKVIKMFQDLIKGK